MEDDNNWSTTWVDFLPVIGYCEGMGEAYKLNRHRLFKTICTYTPVPNAAIKCSMFIIIMTLSLIVTSNLNPTARDSYLLGSKDHYWVKYSARHFVIILFSSPPPPSISRFHYSLRE